MGNIHDQLERHGRQGALAFVDTPSDRKALDAAFNFMSDEDSRTGFLFSGWCQTALPHKKLLNDEVWTHKTDYVRLMIEPGSIHSEDGQTSRVGVPYGSRARLILLFLQSEAIRTDSREITLGRSLRVWLGKLNVPIGGTSMREVREQALRIARCRMTFQISSGNKTGFVNQNIVDTSMFSGEMDGSLLDTVRLSESFFGQLKRHPVPLQEAAIRAISSNSQALDLYCWLAYRLHSLEHDCPITWSSLHKQFGSSYKALKHFRPRFLESLQVAMAVYPEARVSLSEVGLVLHPSKAPIAPRLRSQDATPLLQTKVFKLHTSS